MMNVAITSTIRPVFTSRNMMTPNGTTEGADPQVHGAPADLVGQAGPKHRGENTRARPRRTGPTRVSVLVASPAFFR